MTDKQIIINGVDVSGFCQYMPRYMEDMILIHLIIVGIILNLVKMLM